jgi:subtilisin family serine protease
MALLPRFVNVLAASCLVVVSAPMALAQTTPAAARSSAEPVQDRYIVLFKKDVANPQAEAQAIVRGVANARLHHVYASALKGFAATLPAQSLESIRRNPMVESIEQDYSVRLNQTSPQNSATWGLDRIDQADRPLDMQYRFLHTGSGVHAFIIDTGIRLDHVEFSGRLLPGADFVGDGRGPSDCQGHGTHVAGTVGATTWGVAKQVKLLPVRVLGCDGAGSYSGVIAGIDWTASSTLRPAVANVSLGGPLSSALNQAVAGAVGKGVVMVVAAGNDNVDACTKSPAAEPSAITVGASTSADQRASYSNFGPCVDLFAPGSGITSASFSSPTASASMSGTSMAAPHVAGVAALALQHNPEAAPAAVSDFLKSNGSANKLAGVGTGSPNVLLYSLASGSAPAPAIKSVAVASLSGSSTSVKGGKGSWAAAVTVGVRDLSGAGAVAHATVSASFSPGGAVSCSTGSTGSCVLRSGTLTKSVASTTLTVSGVAGTGLVYDATQNTATRVTVSKP